MGMRKAMDLSVVMVLVWTLVEVVALVGILVRAVEWARSMLPKKDVETQREIKWEEWGLGQEICLRRPAVSPPRERVL